MATQAVLKTLLDDPGTARYGLELARSAGLTTGSMYPILARLERMGWVASTWEDESGSDVARPRRRYYRLTSFGHAQGIAAVKAAMRRITPASWLSAD